MNKRTLLFALLTFFSFGATAQISFESGTLEAALAKAKKENKPLFVDVHAVWCGPCKRMAATAFVDPKVTELYNKGFVSLKLDGEKNDGPSVMQKYGISAYPTLLYFSPDGTLVKKVVGGQEAAQLISHGDFVLNPESSPSFKARKVYHSSKKTQKDTKAFIEGLVAAEDDSVDFYAAKYYAAYPKLDLNDKVELEVFMRNENDLHSPLSQDFLLHPERFDAETYSNKIGMFVQTSYAKAVEKKDFSIIEKDVREVYPYIQKANSQVPELESYIEYIRTEFNKN